VKLSQADLPRKSVHRRMEYSTRWPGLIRELVAGQLARPQSHDIFGELLF
jgi:hypothetical protein